jgi:hypothetical protein
MIKSGLDRLFRYEWSSNQNGQNGPNELNR